MPLESCCGCGAPWNNQRTLGKPHSSVRAHRVSGRHIPMGQTSSSFGLAHRQSWYRQLWVPSQLPTRFPPCSVADSVEAQFVWIFRLFCGIFLQNTDFLRAHRGDDCWQLRSRSWGCWNVDIQLMGLNSAQVPSLFCETWWINSEFPVIWVKRDVDSQMF